MMRKCENYVTNQGVNCVLSSFADNVSLYNEKFDDSYIFFLMNGFDIRYVETCFDDVYEILFSHNLDRLIEKFMRRYGITYGFYSRNHSFDEFLEWTKTKIHNSSPILLTVYANNLDYSISFSNNHNQIHSINIIGYNDCGVLISDCFVPSVPPKTYEGVISYDALEKMWNDKESGLFKIYDIYYEKGIQDISITDELILESLHTNFTHYFDTNHKKSYVRAINNLCDNLERVLVETIDVKETSSLLANKFNLESIIPARELLKKCLTRLSASIAIEAELLQEIEDLLGKWKRLQYKLIMAGIRNKVNYFQDVVASMRQLLVVEQELFQRIDSIIVKDMNT